MFRRGSVWVVGLILLFSILFLERSFSADVSQHWYFGSSQDWSQGVFQGTVFEDGVLKLSKDVQIGWQQQRPELNGPARGVSIDPQQNLVISGYSQASASMNRIHIIKCDPNGQVLWEKTQQNGPSSRSTGVATDGSGNVYVTGYAISASGTYDYQLYKFNPDGSLMWSRTLDLQGEDQAQAVAVAPGGFVIVTGNSSLNGYDTLTAKYNAQGQLMWQKRFDHGGGEWAWGMTVDESGDIFVAGGKETSGNKDALLLKYNPSGQILWQKFLDRGGDETARDVAVSSTGDVAITGYSENTRGMDIFTAVYDANGQLKWVAQEDLSTKDRAFATVWGYDGSLFVTGSAIAFGTESIHTFKYTSKGRQIWTRFERSAFAARGYDIEADAMGNVYVIGMEGTGYRTIQYQDGYVAEGKFITPAHRYNSQARFKTFSVTAQLSGQTVTAVVESSNNNFRTIAGQEFINLRAGETHYSLRGLQAGSAVRVRFLLNTHSPRFSPSVYDFTIMASN